MNHLSGITLGCGWRAFVCALFLGLFGGPVGAVLRIESVADYIDPSGHQSFVATSNKLFFHGAGGGGYNIFATDGTRAGTVQLHDPFPGDLNIIHTPLWRVGERVYFGAAGNSTGWSVYESDGTPEGTRRLVLSNDNMSSYYPNAVTDWNGEAWFERGGSLFRVATAGANVEHMADLYVQSYWFKPMIVRGGFMYAAGTQSLGKELARVWRIERDGKLSVVPKVPAGAAVMLFDGPGGVLAFVQQDVAPYVNELWRIADDGAVDLVRRSEGPMNFESQGIHKGRFWFADAPSDERMQLYSTDGTAKGTRVETDLPTPEEIHGTFALTTFREERYGVVSVDASPRFSSLVRFDRSHPQGAQQIRRIRVSGSFGPILITYADRLLFSVFDATFYRSDLWYTDGTPGGTQKVALQKSQERQRDQSDTPIGVLGEWFYFTRKTEDGNVGLWRLRGEASDFPARETHHVVEYYNRLRDHYFMTGREDEIAILDSGRLPEWKRTGEGFTTFAPGSGDAKATGVCRFYGLPSVGLDSHFYTAFPEECEYVVRNFSGAWQFESANIFEVAVSEKTGECPQGFRPLYRTFNQRSDINHRYATDERIQAAMVVKGWRPEGFGPGVSMCVLASDTVQ